MNLQLNTFTLFLKKIILAITNGKNSLVGLERYNIRVNYFLGGSLHFLNKTERVILFAFIRLISLVIRAFFHRTKEMEIITKSRIGNKFIGKDIFSYPLCVVVSKVIGFSLF